VPVIIQEQSLFRAVRLRSSEVGGRIERISRFEVDAIIPQEQDLLLPAGNRVAGTQRQNEALAILELVRIKGAEPIASRLRRKLEVAVAIARAEGGLEGIPAPRKYDGGPTPATGLCHTQSWYRAQQLEHVSNLAAFDFLTIDHRDG
jgi:hypothetical protein